MFSYKLMFTLLLYFIAHDFVKLSHAVRTFSDSHGNKLLVGKIGEILFIKCVGEESPLRYCSIEDPQGNTIESTYGGLQKGYCFTIVKLNLSHIGEWGCHTSGMSPSSTVGKHSYTIRVANSFAAVNKSVSQVMGYPLTLSCVSVTGMKPLNYCLFESPKGDIIVIDNTHTYNSSMKDMYHFNSDNRSIDSGDCSVTIKKLQKMHIGQWKCKARIKNGTTYTDTINVSEIPFYKYDDFIIAIPLVFGFGMAYVIYKIYKSGKNNIQTSNIEMSYLTHQPERSRLEEHYTTDGRPRRSQRRIMAEMYGDDENSRNIEAERVALLPESTSVASTSGIHTGRRRRPSSENQEEITNGTSGGLPVISSVEYPHVVVITANQELSSDENSPVRYQPPPRQELRSQQVFSREQGGTREQVSVLEQTSSSEQIPLLEQVRTSEQAYALEHASSSEQQPIISSVEYPHVVVITANQELSSDENSPVRYQSPLRQELHSQQVLSRDQEGTLEQEALLEQASSSEQIPLLEQVLTSEIASAQIVPLREEDKETLI